MQDKAGKDRSRNSRAQDKAGRARTGQRGAGAHRTTRGGQDIEDSEITIYDISRYRRKERKGKKELGGVAPRVRPTGVGGIGRRGIISRTMDTEDAA